MLTGVVHAGMPTAESCSCIDIFLCITYVIGLCIVMIVPHYSLTINEDAFLLLSFPTALSLTLCRDPSGCQEQAFVLVYCKTAATVYVL